MHRYPRVYSRGVPGLAVQVREADEASCAPVPGSLTLSTEQMHMDMIHDLTTAAAYMHPQVIAWLNNL
mgnify:CR=1 FL=1